MSESTPTARGGSKPNGGSGKPDRLVRIVVRRKTAIAVFFVTTILTSLTGFPLPPFGFDPPRAVGVLSLILLAGAVAAYYGLRLAGAWRQIFVACAVAALYLNVFVLVAQGFLKIPALHALAPTGSEPPFAIVQGIVLLIFIALGIAATIKFRPIDDRRWAGR